MAMMKDIHAAQNGTYLPEPREKITFAIGEPVTVRLDYSDGKPCEGRFGDQWQWICDEDRRIMWIDPQVRQRILATGATAGDEVQITKREIREGSKRRIDWQVELVADEPIPFPHPGTRTAAPPASPPQRKEPASASLPPQVTAPAPASSTNPLIPHLQQAIDAAVWAEAHARGEGLLLRFSAEDVRALALSMYIDQRKGGVR